MPACVYRMYKKGAPGATMNIRDDGTQRIIIINETEKQIIVNGIRVEPESFREVIAKDGNMVVVSSLSGYQLYQSMALPAILIRIDD